MSPAASHHLAIATLVLAALDVLTVIVLVALAGRAEDLDE